MFTGIVSAVGTVVEAGSNRLRVEAPGLALAVGGSVAVNGCCLTAAQVSAGGFAADVVPETLRRSNLGRLLAGSRVNLEAPLTLSAPLDGHLVQGHVDGTGAVREVRRAGPEVELTVELAAELERFVAPKGSIAVDGTSLTVTAVGPGTFAVALIPRTLTATIAGDYVPGSEVNLEVDLLARYLDRLLPGIK